MGASGKVPNKGNASGTVDIDAKYTGATAGGPSDSDLDYSSWGTCYPVTPPGDGSVIDTIFQPHDKTFVTEIIDKVMLQSADRKMFLESMQTKPRSDDNQVVV